MSGESQWRSWDHFKCSATKYQRLTHGVGPNRIPQYARLAVIQEVQGKEASRAKSTTSLCISLQILQIFRFLPNIPVIIDSKLRKMDVNQPSSFQSPTTPIPHVAAVARGLITRAINVLLQHTICKVLGAQQEEWRHYLEHDHPHLLIP